MTKFPDITITSLETITAFTLAEGDYLFTLDELQNATIDQTQETVDITGKQGRKLAKLKRNKQVSVSGDSGMISGGLLEVQTGSRFSRKNATSVMWIDYLYVEDDEAETQYKAIGTKGAEITNLYIKNADGTLGTLMEQSYESGDGKFTYDPSTKKLGFTGIKNGTEIVVYYMRNISADTLTNESDVYSTKCQVYINAIGEDKCDNVYRIQFYFPKADFEGEFSFEMGDNQTVHSFSFESLAGACGAGGMLWTVTIFGIIEGVSKYHDLIDNNGMNSLLIDSFNESIFTGGDAYWF